MSTSVQSALFRTAGGGRLHLRPCPHLVGSKFFEATAADHVTHEVCQWSRNEMDGVGRTNHVTVEAALADMGAPQHALPELARLLKLVEYDGVFVPYSRSYVAVTKNNEGVAWAGKTYVDYSDRPAALLADFVPGSGGGPAAAERPWGPKCPECFQTRSLSGSCQCTED